MCIRRLHWVVLCSYQCNKRSEKSTAGELQKKSDLINHNLCAIVLQNWNSPMQCVVHVRHLCFSPQKEFSQKDPLFFHWWMGYVFEARGSQTFSFWPSKCSRDLHFCSNIADIKNQQRKLSLSDFTSHIKVISKIICGHTPQNSMNFYYAGMMTQPEHLTVTKKTPLRLSSWYPRSIKTSVCLFAYLLFTGSPEMK